ncbi:MAG TPA: hypothetical protein VE988_11960 [Gemmataceae bacterium]|nr:hypothetical protein [Gemmataceae bacterium]
MRWQFKAMIIGAFSMGLYSLAVAQQPLQIGNIRGLFSKDGRSDPIGLLKNRDVRLELKLTDEQMLKVEAAIWKMLAETLDAEQVKRLYQIDLQQRDYKVFIDPKVQADLQFDDGLKQTIKAIVIKAEEEVETRMKELEEGAAANPQAVVDTINAKRREAKQQCLECLSTEQARLWREMLGDPFLFTGVKIDINQPPPAKKKAKKGG